MGTEICILILAMLLTNYQALSKLLNHLAEELDHTQVMASNSPNASK